MFAAARGVAAPRSFARAFSSTPSRQADLAKLILIGRLGRDPEARTTRGDKEFVTYTVATTNYPPPPPNPDGTRNDAGTSWHTVYSFNPSSNNYLKTLVKGTQVYVEANYEIREGDASADPSSPSAQRQVFLRHETLRVLKRPYNTSDSEPSDHESSESS